MSLRKPTVYNADGSLEELPTTDTLDAAISETEVWQAKNANAGAATIGQVVYKKAAGTTDVDLAKADAKATSKNTIGLVADSSIAAAATGSIKTAGVLNNADWTTVTGASALTVGAEYFVSAATAGSLTTTVPSTAASTICRVGIALDAQHMLIAIEFRGSRAT